MQQLVTDAADLFGWSWVHHRPARTATSWRTPTSGPLGKGWVDLLLVHPLKRRVLALELKTSKGVVTADQRRVHDVLRAGGIEVMVVRPADVDELLEVLR